MRRCDLGLALFEYRCPSEGSLPADVRQSCPVAPSLAYLEADVGDGLLVAEKGPRSEPAYFTIRKAGLASQACIAVRSSTMHSAVHPAAVS